MSVLVILTVKLLHLVIASDRFSLFVNLVFQCEYNAIFTVASSLGKSVNGNGQFGLLVTTCLINMHPRRARSHLPVAIGIEDNGANI